MSLRQRLIRSVLFFGGMLAVGCGPSTPRQPDEITPEMRELDRQEVQKIENAEG